MKRKLIIAVLVVIVLIPLYFSSEIIKYFKYKDNYSDEGINYNSEPVIVESEESFKDDNLEAKPTEREEVATKNGARVEIGNRTFPIIRIANNDFDRLRLVPGLAYYGEGRVNLIVYDREGIHPAIIFPQKFTFNFDFVWVNSAGKVVDIKKGITRESFPEIFKPKQAAKYLMILDNGSVDSFSIKVGEVAKFYKLNDSEYKLVENFSKNTFFPAGDTDSSSGLIYYSAKEDAVYFNAEIDFWSFASLYLLVNKYNPSKIITDSTGGDTYTGVKIGKLINEYNLDVEVVDQCFSSCANYIFTAAKNKYINKNALVAWHGSPAEDGIVAELEGFKNVRDYYNDRFNYIKNNDPKVKDYKRTLRGQDLREYEKDFESLRDVFVSGHVYVRDLEIAFYKKIGVDARVTSYGLYIYDKPNEKDYYPLLDEYKREYGEDVLNTNPIDGETFSIKDMNSFGIKNISYGGGGEYPEVKSTPKLEFIFLLKRIDP